MFITHRTTRRFVRMFIIPLFCTLIVLPNRVFLFPRFAQANESLVKDYTVVYEFVQTLFDLRNNLTLKVHCNKVPPEEEE